MKNFITMTMCLFFAWGASSQELKPISYMDGEQKLHGFVTSNAGQDLPGVLILPAWKGIDNEAKLAAINLEKEGYIAFVADIYGEGNVPADNAAAMKIAGFYKSNYKNYQQRIQVALEELKRQGANEDKIAVIGFCFGGTGALEAARAGFLVQGVVSIHGGLGKDKSRTNEPLTAKILVEHPAEDPTVSEADFDGLVQEMNASKADWQIITYAHCGHTFTNPESPEYNPLMAKRAWNHTLLFLAELLQ